MVKAKSAAKFQLYVISVDFDTKIKSRHNPPYYRLKKLLSIMGGVVGTTHQIKLLLSPLSATKIKNRIKSIIILKRDRVYVGKIAKGSAWHNLLTISNEQLKEILRVYAKGAVPTKSYLAAARKALKDADIL